MSDANEQRPRRAMRAVVKVPTELTARPRTTAASASARRRNGAGARGKSTRGRGKGKGKRAAGDDDGYGDDDNDDDDESDNGNNGGNNSEEEDSRNADTVGGAEDKSSDFVSRGTKGRSTESKAKSGKDSLHDIEYILTSPKSPLVNVDISDVLNFHTWNALSTEARTRLCRLLPQTALGIHPQCLDEFHPSKRVKTQTASTAGPSAPSARGYETADEPMQVDENDSLSALGNLSLDASFFIDPHFESAARTFQDHLYSGWLTPAHRALVEKHLAGVRSGLLHVPWKDEEWEHNHPEDGLDDDADASDDAQDRADAVSIGVRGGKRKSKEIKASDFAPLVGRGFLKEGDVISFKHKFISLNVTIEKDALIKKIHPKSSVLTLTASVGTAQDLPPALLMPLPSNSSSPKNARAHALREMVVASPQQLANALLDLDGRVPRAARPRLDAWKALSVWRWAGDVGADEFELGGMVEAEAALLERGGREVYGTLFYLRGAALDE